MKLRNIFIFIALCFLILGCSEEKAEVKEKSLDNSETKVIVEEQNITKEKEEEKKSEKTAAEILEEMRANSTIAIEEEEEEVQENSTEETVLSSESITILIEDFKPSPKEITIKKGTKVIWENADNFYHMIAIYKTEHDRVQLAKGETYTYVFEDEGDYTWFSSPHPKTQGKINVTG